MRIFTFVLSLFFIITISSPVYASSVRCPRHQTKTNLKSKLAKTRVYKGSSNDFSDYVLGPHRGEGQVLGFVNQSEIYTRLTYKFGLKEIKENQYCVSLEQVDGYFYAAPQLYLPTDYPKSSCEYQQIYKHEKRHLKVVYDFHKRNSQKYNSTLGRIARTVPIPDPVSSQEEIEDVQQAIVDYYESEFREFEAQSIIELNAAQRKIDSPSEYIGVQKRCSNW